MSRDIIDDDDVVKSFSKQDVISPQKRKADEDMNCSSSMDLILIRFENPPRRNLCFSNVTVSCLLNIPHFRKYLRGMKNMNEDPMTIMGELSVLARHLSNSQKSTDKLRTIVKTKCYNTGQTTRNFNNNLQFDCVEFLQSLLEHLWKEQSLLENIDEVVFGGLFQETMKCKCGNKQNLPIQRMAEVIPLQLQSQCVQSCLEAFFSSVVVERKCPNCESQKSLKTLVYLGAHMVKSLNL